MAGRYQQFLGSNPGMFVELVDQSRSPYILCAEDGFEFVVASEDFKNYYRLENEPIPKEWSHLVTDAERGFADTRQMAQVMSAIKPWEDFLGDFAKARAFVREALTLLKNHPDNGLRELRSRVAELRTNQQPLADRAIETLITIPPQIRKLLLSDRCAVIPLPTGVANQATTTSLDDAAPFDRGDNKPFASNREQAGVKKVGMKNVELQVQENILKIVCDLSREYGPSKSGKTIIVASTEGNKSVPGRDEKIGLNIYRQQSGKQATGRRSSFKNVEMSVQEERLEITVDLSKEFGASRSGKTVIVASTEGNQRVVGREEKIGLNVYKKLE